MSTTPKQPSPDIRGDQNGDMAHGTSNKRKPSPSTSREDLANSSKRARRGNERQPAHSPQGARRQSPERHPNTSQEEKKRGKRLFGGLLSTLSQKPGAIQQKRRHEIEKRQQDRAQKQQVEDDKQREERLASLTHKREIQQVKFDERMMETRHSDMLAKAHFLQTNSYPSIYYLPWELTEKQKDIIQDQVSDAEKIVDTEASRFRSEKEHRLRALGVTPKSSKADATEAKPEPVSTKTSNIPEKDAAHDSKPDESGRQNDCLDEPSRRANTAAKVADDTEDVVVEAQEDTVIY